MTYIPKGSMCASCQHKHRDCSHLPFRDMPRLSEYLRMYVVVKCTDYKRESA